MGDSSSSFNNIYQDNLTENINAQNINVDVDNLTHGNDTDATINNLLNRNNVTARDHLFQAMFSRIALTYDRTFPPFARRFIEFMLLLTAISVLFILIYIHMAFVKAPITCLDHLSFNENIVRDASDGSIKQMVIRVEVLSNPPLKYNLYNSYSKEYDDLNRINQSEPLETSKLPLNEKFSRLLMFLNIVHKQCYKNSTNFEYRQEQSNNDNLYVEFNKNDEKNSDKSAEGILHNLFNFPINPILEKAEYWREQLSVRAMAPFRQTFNELELFAKSVFTEEKYIMEYSLEYGLLRLTPQTRERLNIPVHFVLLDANKDQCFGNGISRFLLQEFVGYDQIIIGSLKRLAERQNGKGYVRNVVSGEHYRFVNSWMSRTSYLAAGFIMIIFTLSVSMLLRYSHHQIFVFIVDLLRMLENNLQFSFPAAPLLTVVLALVGMEAIMSEFFNDTSTAFYTILIIWLADQYEAVCCRTYVSKRHWPKYFYLYHFAFYAYHYRFNGQFSGLALLCSWLFIQHSMFFFFHHYELPRLMHGIAVRAIMDSLNVDRSENRPRSPNSMFPNDDDNERSDGDRYDHDEDPESPSSMPSMASGEIREQNKNNNDKDEDGQNTEENQRISNDSNFRSNRMYRSNSNDPPQRIKYQSTVLLYAVKLFQKELLSNGGHVNCSGSSDHLHLIAFNCLQIPSVIFYPLYPPFQTNIKHIYKSFHRKFDRKSINHYYMSKHYQNCPHQLSLSHLDMPNVTVSNGRIRQINKSHQIGYQNAVNEDFLNGHILIVLWFLVTNVTLVMVIITIRYLLYRSKMSVLQDQCGTRTCSYHHRRSCFYFPQFSRIQPGANQLIYTIHLGLNQCDRPIPEFCYHPDLFPATFIVLDLVWHLLKNSISFIGHSDKLSANPAFRCLLGPWISTQESAQLKTESNISSPCLQD